MPRVFPALFFLCLMLPGTAFAAGLAIVNVTVYPSPDAQPIPDAVVLVEDGLIAAVGPRDEISIPKDFTNLDRSGKHVTAGFWNSHVHLTSPALLDAVNLSDAELGAILTGTFTRYGFTTVFDVASSTPTAMHLKRRVSSADVDAPRILTVGDPFYPQGGTPVYVVEAYREAGLPLPEISSAEQGMDRVAFQHKAGVDGIKLFTGAITGGAADVVPMPLAHARAVVERAHELGMPVFAHPTNADGLQIAMESGVDVLAHTAPLAGRWSADFVAALKERNIALVPTLALFVVHPDPSTPLEIALQQVGALHAAGGDVLFGTDTGFISAAEAAREFELLGRVMNWRDILASLTTTPACRFGEADRRGRLVPGYVADLVVLNTGPAGDVTAFSHVHETLRDGRVVYREVSSPPSN